MHNGVLRKWALALTFWLALHLSCLEAQTLPFGPYGTSSTAKTDALVVYKNGNVAAQGVITAAAGGDIPMYTGN